MIELDEIRRHDFLSDEARSGFGDDGESFGLGRYSEAPSAGKEQESEQIAAAPVEVSSTDVTPTEVVSIEVALMETTPQKLENSSDVGKAKQSESVENTMAVAPVVAPIPDELPVEQQSDDYHNKSEEQNLTEHISEPSNKASESLTAPVLDDELSVENSISIADSDVEDLTQEKYADEPSISKIPTAHEAYIPPIYAHSDTIITENASTDGSRKVITIPSAEEQRKEDAEKASAQTTQSNINTPRRNTWSRNAIAASLAGILLAALVASGYMLMRKTTIGSGAQNLWATLTGGHTESGVQDSAALTLLDLTKKSQEKNALNNENQNLPNNTSNTSSKTSVPAVTTSVESQTANAQSTQPPTAQSSNDATKAEISSAPVSSQNKPTTLAANTPSATSQAQEKPPQVAATPKQIPDTKLTTSTAPSTKQPPNNQATKTTTNKQEATTPAPTTAKAKKASSASALERKQTQQISGVFAIQVYATPSIADAEDWVERLKRRGMVNAMVTSQVVRGQTMYRVRFGLYNTLHDAERDAERFGYMGSWVVRLR